MNSLFTYRKLRKGKGKGKPLYEQIRSQLTQQIRSGRIEPGSRLPSVSQMVKEWQVDYQTVGLALDAMEKDGVIQHENGRGKGPVVLKNIECTYSITFLRWSSIGYPLEITEGIRKYAEEKNLKFSITDISHSHSSLINVISHPMQGTDGIIIVPPPDNDEFRKVCLDVLKLGVKVVFVDLNIADLPVSSVSIDHVGGAHQATRHLLSLHNMPIYCLGVTSLSSVQSRLQGWVSAMREYNFYDCEPYIYEIPYTDTRLENSLQLEQQVNYKAAMKILDKQNCQKTCIFTCCGSAAQGVYQAAGERGLKIGSDVFVAGFGDSPTCRQLPVPFTFVGQKWEDVGYEAAYVLFMEMAGNIRHPMYRLLPAQLNIRTSSKGRDLEDHNFNSL